jgi:hypothetical protein
MAHCFTSTFKKLLIGLTHEAKTNRAQVAMWSGRFFHQGQLCVRLLCIMVGKSAKAFA